MQQEIHISSQGELAGTPAALVLAAADADADANVLQHIASQGHLAARSNDLMSRVDEQVHLTPTPLTLLQTLSAKLITGLYIMSHIVKA